MKKLFITTMLLVASLVATSAKDPVIDYTTHLTSIVEAINSLNTKLSDLQKENQALKEQVVSAKADLSALAAGMKTTAASGGATMKALIKYGQGETTFTVPEGKTWKIISSMDLADSHLDVRYFKIGDQQVYSPSTKNRSPRVTPSNCPTVLPGGTTFTVSPFANRGTYEDDEFYPVNDNFIMFIEEYNE